MGLTYRPLEVEFVRRVSAKFMYLPKWVVPVLGFAWICVSMLVNEQRKAHPDFAVLIPVLVMAALILVLVFWKRVWVLADEVLDGGNHLMVRFGKRQQTISISNINGVTVRRGSVWTTVHLNLSVPSEFGHVISWLARPGSSLRPDRSVDELIGRIQAVVGRSVA